MTSRIASSLVVSLVAAVCVGGLSTSRASESPAPPAAKPASATEKTATPKPAKRESATTKTSSAAASVSSEGASEGKPRGDRLDLDPTVVTGNRELPKVLYIVPWKKAEPGDLPSQPFNTLLDEALTPVDRDVFRREVTYYGAVSSATNSTDPASPASAKRPEK